MNDFDETPTIDLCTETFLGSLQNRALNPLNEETQTDFILVDGITIALRKSESALILKIMKYPSQMSVVVPNPNERLIRQNGEVTVREIIATMIVGLKRQRIRLVQDEPMPEGLLDTIFDSLYLFADNESRARRGRASIYAPSSIQRPGFSTTHTNLASAWVQPVSQNKVPSRQVEIQSSLEPLLQLIPEGSVRVAKVEGALAAHKWARGHDYAIIPSNYERLSSNDPSGSVLDRMEIIQRLLVNIPKFGEDPLPIISLFDS